MNLTPKDIGLLLHARDQTQLWHWQSKSFEEHSVLGDFYSAWLDLVDSLVETDAMAGVPPTPPAMPALVAYSAGAGITFLTKTLAPYVATLCTRLRDQPGLQNIAADMQNLVHHTIYKLSLK